MGDAIKLHLDPSKGRHVNCNCTGMQGSHHLGWCTVISSKTVKVHDTGKFLDGKVFDSTVSQGKPIEFVLGWDRVIHGWDEGITLRNIGGKSVLTIPPNAILVLDVELVEVK